MELKLKNIKGSKFGETGYVELNETTFKNEKLYVIHLTDEPNEEDIIHIYTTLDEAETYYKDTIRLAEPEETDKCARCKKTFEIDYLNYYSPSDYEAEEDDEKLYCDSCYEIVEKEQENK